jgi:cytochrome c-type biogenesis protein CcmH
MTLWLCITLLVAGGILFLLWPLIRGGRGADPLAREVALYAARQQELIRQRETGEISAQDCEAALAEQGRALLALHRARGAVEAGGNAGAMRRRKQAALLLLVGLPLLTLPIYLRLGAPDLPDQPLAARAPQPLDVASAIGKIEAHLAQNPNDLRGFEVIAPVYLKAGRYTDAVRAYTRVIALAGETSERLSDLGESLVAEQDGLISAQAREAFARAVQLDASYPKPKFYLALAREQEGDAAGALADLEKIVLDLPESPARSRVSAEIRRLRVQTGVAPGTPADMVANLPVREREIVIRQMVEGLDTRLSEAGGTLAEWRQLVQARLVLHQRDAAEAALAKARAAFAADASAGPELDALAAAIKAEPAP